MFGKSVDSLEREHRKRIHLCRPLCSITSLLEKLKGKGIRVALATNCCSQVLLWRLTLLNINPQIFDALITSSDVSSVVDKAEFYEKAMTILRVEPKDCMIVSDDREKDLLPAKCIGAKTVWMAGAERRHDSEFGTPSLPVHLLTYQLRCTSLNGPCVDFVLENPMEILRIVE
jgi:FMN phosphatase YigB (HAD superfamily)